MEALKLPVQAVIGLAASVGSLVLLSVVIMGEGHSLPLLLLSGHVWRSFVPESLSMVAFVSGVLGALLPFLSSFLRRNLILLMPAIVVSAVTSSVAVTGLFATTVRRIEIRKFQPDHVVTRSFLTSLRQVGDGFSMYLHGAALKDCVPYGWSYRTMSFYELSDRRRIDQILPNEFYTICSFERQF